ncbi:hypothetical protein TWF481_000924 [Arthrobotrys musiformis]|uniref:Gluconokinase n=1 Tax=Arthrobotrys musiformis TaxID=47236 RepID=A0AAV9WV42_9PEZI
MSSHDGASEIDIPLVASHRIPHIFIIAGPAATGKTTVARAIAEAFGLPMVEGDDLHPQENIEKMSQGHPLTDEDRWGWLKTVASVSVDSSRPPTSPPYELDEYQGRPACITTCSALKRRYRDLLRSQLPQPETAILNFIFLTASEEELLRRIEERNNHFMKKNMVRSQIVTAEVPKESESDGGDEGDVENDCTVIWTDNLSQDEVAEKALEVVKQLIISDFGNEYPNGENEDESGELQADDI